MENFIGYDCDGEEIEEYRVLRAPFSELIEDWSEVTDVDPRLYCAVKAYDNKYYLISIYDHWSIEEIRKFEHLKEDEPVITIIKDIKEAEKYASAFTNDDLDIWYYEFDKEELVQKLNKMLKQKEEMER
jgi:hypothetical protein